MTPADPTQPQVRVSDERLARDIDFYRKNEAYAKEQGSNLGLHETSLYLDLYDERARNATAKAEIERLTAERDEARDKLRWLETWEASEAAADPLKANRVLLMRDAIHELCDEQLRTLKHEARNSQGRAVRAEAERDKLAKELAGRAGRVTETMVRAFGVRYFEGEDQWLLYGSGAAFDIRAGLEAALAVSPAAQHQGNHECQLDDPRPQECWLNGCEAKTSCDDCQKFESPAAQPDPADAAPLCFTYRNYRGEVGQRRVRPIAVRYGTTEWHPDPSWLLRAFDLDKGAEREFAMADMRPDPADAKIAEAVQAEREPTKATAAEKLMCPHTARFEGWSDDDLGKQLRMQAKEHLDPEYSAFLKVAGDRLVAAAIRAEPKQGDAT